MIDSHCHLEFRHFEEDREEVIEKSKETLEAVVDSGVDRGGAEDVLDLHDRYPDFVFASLGLHPKTAVNMSDEEINLYKDFIVEQMDRIVAIGEVGLDYYHVKGSAERRKSEDVFSEFCKLSNDAGLPLVVHSRDSMHKTLNILEDSRETVVIHCFSGDLDDLEEALDRDYYISFGGMVFRSRQKYEGLIAKTPLDRLLLETDAPFLAKKKGERSEPWFIRDVAERIAEVKQVEFDEVWATAARNAKEVFGITL